MGITERRKGASGEREIVGILRQFGWPHAERTSRGIAQAGRGDIANGPPGVHLEVTRRERLNLPNKFDQVVRDADPLDIPILCHRPSRHAWMATIPLLDLLPILQVRER